MVTDAVVFSIERRKPAYFKYFFVLVESFNDYHFHALLESAP